MTVVVQQMDSTFRQQPQTGASAPGVLERFNFTVCGVLFVFFYLYFVDVAFVILPWLSFSVPGMLNLMLLSATTGSALACYFTCMFADPGRVPVGWCPDTEQQGSMVQEVKKKDGAPRFCNKCGHYKPPRSHHCRVCKRCVLRMDHHCPWVNNCIGHCNYRAFFGLLIYATLALFHSTALIVGHAVHVVRAAASPTPVIRVGPHATPHALDGPDTRHFMAHIFIQMFAAAIALPTSIAVLMLLVWHIRMVAHNKTTIEHAEGVTAQIKLGVAGKDRLRHPYDLGPCHNAHEILGDNPATWLLPACYATPGGLSYPTTFDKKADYFSF